MTDKLVEQIEASRSGKGSGPWTHDMEARILADAEVIKAAEDLAEAVNARAALSEMANHAQAEKEAAVAAEREACAERCEANAGGLTYYGPEPHILDACNIRARGNTDALAAHDARVKAEALRDLLDLKWTCFHNLETEVDVVSVHDILALIPDQHKETEE